MMLAHTVSPSCVADSATTETLDILFAAATPLDRSLVTTWLDCFRWLGHGGAELSHPVVENDQLIFESSGAIWI